jgi:enterochelin esterase-like enzyme
MRDALVDHGYSVSYEELAGGHDLASWENDLPNSLKALMH